MKTLKTFRTLILSLMLWSSSVSALEFEITFVDPGGTYTAYYSVIESHIKAAGAEWAKYIKSDEVAETFVYFDEFSANTGAAAAGSSPDFVIRQEGGLAILEPGIAHKIKTGIDFNGSSSDPLTADITILVNQNILLDNGFNFDPDPFDDESGYVVNGNSDFKNVMMHEIGHALGFQSYGFNADGSPFSIFRRTYDLLIIFQNDNFFFTGSRATAVYGGFVPLHFQSESHLGNNPGSGRPGTEFSSDVMHTSDTNGRKTINALHVAILADLGYPIRDVNNDFSGDRKSDILWRNINSGTNVIYQMDGATIQSAAIINQVDASQWAIAGTGDFNGDGKSDILWRNINNGTNVIYLMDGDTIQSAVIINQVSDLNWEIVGTDDFNSDGKTDILWRHAVNGLNIIYQMDGTTIQSAAIINQVNDLNWEIVGTGDFNGDGKSDILWHHFGNGANLIYQMDGASIQSAAFINQVNDLNWQIIGTSDFNGDGKTDILWRHALSGLNLIYQMDGTTIQSAAIINQVNDLNWGVVGTGDFTGDGKSDIFWRHGISGLNIIYQMDGTTIQSAMIVNQVDDLNWKVESP